ncbi:MAG: hypothetical protein KDC32_14240, partial [Saprospiraceae bacterium]|nr:hypothetical protein [Saprospiraceae bacterium]
YELENTVENTFIGTASGYNTNRATTFGSQNTFFGFQTGFLNRNGEGNVGIGANADVQQPGLAGENRNNVFIGSSVSVDGNESISIGYDATADASNSVVIGSEGLVDDDQSVAIGNEVSVTQLQSIAIGAQATTAYLNTVAIGYQATVLGANQVVLGNSSTTSIGGVVNWTATSDGRFKS